ARAALRAPGRRRRDRGGHGSGDRARLLLGRWRRDARGGQLPDHRGGCATALAVPRRDRAVPNDDLIWTGALNDAYRVGGRVGLYDTTLRDGEQTVGV